MTDPQLQISETIDGRPVGERAERSKAASTARSIPNKPDKYIWGIYLFLVFVSIIEVYSASSTEVDSANVYSPLTTHILFLVGGLGIVIGFQNLHYKFYRKLAWPAAILCLGLVIYAAHAGVRLNDAMRAIRITGNITIQPAEMMKLAVVMVLAKIMAKHQMAGGVTTRGVVYSFITMGLMCWSVYQNGFTNMALMGVVFLSMLIIGGTQWRKVFTVIGIIAVVAVGAYVVHKNKPEQNAFQAEQAQQQADLADGGAASFEVDNTIDRSDMREGRISMWLKGYHPGDTITDLNYQMIHAQYAMAHGGVRGQMPGNSRESARLPLAYSDYIYSIIVEDTGLVGGLILLLVYMLLVARAGAVASKCSRAFPALLIMGCAVMVTAQALVHMGIVTGVMPVSGQPLPLISKGGTSIVVMSAAFGMMLSVSRFAVRNGDKKAIRAELRDLPSDLQSENPLQLKS